MRPIKFRAWNKETKTMIDLKKVTPLACDIAGLFLPLDAQELELMQFTGLHDEHGKEIYEGDVVNVKRFPDWHRGEVVWSDELAGWHIKCYWSSHPKSDYYGIRFEEVSEIERIGNRLENPELLENNP